MKKTKTKTKTKTKYNIHFLGGMFACSSVKMFKDDSTIYFYDELNTCIGVLNVKKCKLEYLYNIINDKSYRVVERDI